MIKESLSPTSPLPRIMPFLFSPYVTYPPCFKVRLINFKASPVICFGQPPSKYHSCF